VSCVSEENIVLLKDKNIKGLCLDDCVDYIKGEAGFDRDDGNDRRHGREFFFAHWVWILRFRRWESSWKLFFDLRRINNRTSKNDRHRAGPLDPQSTFPVVPVSVRGARGCDDSRP
jgi:hypothetical protein